MTEDTRFNKPAKDGEKFTDEGIYTITATNRYTNQTTTKVIYVGTDDVLKAHVVTGLSISDIEYQLSMGATVAPDGTIIPPPETEPPAIDMPTHPVTTPTEPPDDSNTKNNMPMWPFVMLGLAVVGLILFLTMGTRKRMTSIPREESIDDCNSGKDTHSGGTGT